MHQSLGNIYKDAADVIRRQGWCQKVYGTRDGPVCTLGAVYTAMGGTPHPEDFPERIQASSALKAVTALNGLLDTGVVAWNDHPRRTRTEVLRTLEVAAWVYDDQAPA